MNRCTANLDSARKHTLMDMKTIKSYATKRRNEGWMNIDDSVRICFHDHRWNCHQKACLLRVRCGETEYLAADLVGAGPGDRVILAFGAAARAGRPDVPVDAAIVAILDETEATHG